MNDKQYSTDGNTNYTSLQWLTYAMILLLYIYSQDYL